MPGGLVSGRARGESVVPIGEDLRVNSGSYAHGAAMSLALVRGTTYGGRSGVNHGSMQSLVLSGNRSLAADGDHPGPARPAQRRRHAGVRLSGRSLLGETEMPRPGLAQRAMRDAEYRPRWPVSGRDLAGQGDTHCGACRSRSARIAALGSPWSAITRAGPQAAAVTARNERQGEPRPIITQIAEQE